MRVCREILDVTFSYVHTILHLPYKFFFFPRTHNQIAIRFNTRLKVSQSSTVRGWDVEFMHLL